jgi:hypothetical protein
MNVLVIGTGGFGKHYARIISQLESSGIDNVIITRTSMDSAIRQAAALRKEAKTNVIGMQVANLGQLMGVLDEYGPGFTAVTAKDPEIGDDIHPPYTKAALKYGIVLCEKPFANAKGGGESLEFFKFDHHERFGLELPFAVVYNEIQKNPELYQRFLNARKIRIVWKTKGKRKEENNVINDLALHPWSLIPPEFELKNVDNVDPYDKGNSAKLCLSYSCDSHPVRVEMDLAHGGHVTAIELDGYTIGVKIQGVTNTLVDTQSPLEKVIELGNDGLSGKELLVVDNPLKQHIAAALNGTPIAGFPRAYASQEFLEKLYKDDDKA